MELFACVAALHLSVAYAIRKIDGLRSRREVGEVHSKTPKAASLVTGSGVYCSAGFRGLTTVFVAAWYGTYCAFISTGVRCSASHKYRANWIQLTLLVRIGVLLCTSPTSRLERKPSIFRIA